MELIYSTIGIKNNFEYSVMTCIYLGYAKKSHGWYILHIKSTHIFLSTNP